MVNTIYDVLQHGKFGSDPDLSRQMKRAAVSVMANIAEGFERETDKEFVRYLYVAKASSGELRSHLYVARDRGNLTQVQYEAARNMVVTCSQMLQAFIGSIKKSAVKKATAANPKALSVKRVSRYAKGDGNV